MSRYIITEKTKELSDYRLKRLYITSSKKHKSYHKAAELLLNSKSKILADQWRYYQQLSEKYYLFSISIYRIQLDRRRERAGITLWTELIEDIKSGEFSILKLKRKYNLSKKLQ